jgi:hypothetical protein
MSVTATEVSQPTIKPLQVLPQQPLRPINPLIKKQARGLHN